MNLEEYLNSKSSQPQTQPPQYNPHINTIEDGTPNAGFSGYINYIIASIQNIEL